MAAEAKKEIKGSIEAQAWNKTKDVSDPDWDNIPNQGFKEDLSHAAARVKATGAAETDFEKEVLALQEAEAKAEAKAAEAETAKAKP